MKHFTKLNILISILFLSSTTPLHSKSPTIGVIDSGSHGENVILTIKKYSDNKVNNLVLCSLEKYYQCLEYFAKNPVDVLNLSVQGEYPDKHEKQLLEEISKNTIIVIASGNKDNNQDKNEISYPACYKDISNKLIVVNHNGVSAKNCGIVDVAVDYVTECFKNNCKAGTSQAAAQISGKIYKDLLKLDKKQVVNKYNRR